jgi:hypothetical protein
MVDIVAQQPRTFDQLGNELLFQVESHKGLDGPRIANSLGFSSHSVFTH